MSKFKDGFEYLKSLKRNFKNGEAFANQIRKDFYGIKMETDLASDGFHIITLLVGENEIPVEAYYRNAPRGEYGDFFYWDDREVYEYAEFHNLLKQRVDLILSIKNTVHPNGRFILKLNKVHPLLKITNVDWYDDLVSVDLDVQGEEIFTARKRDALGREKFMIDSTWMDEEEFYHILDGRIKYYLEARKNKYKIS